MARYTEKQKAALETLMKDDVYEHATTIMTHEGLGALTMERLANDVGISRGTLYNYFDDRDAVVDYVEERTFGPVLEAVEEVAAGPLPPEEKMSKIAEWVFTAVYEDRALVIALNPDKQLGANRECQMRRHASAQLAIKAIVEEGIAAGVFEHVCPILTAEIYLGAVHGVIEAMAFRGEFLPAEKVVPTMMKVFLGGLKKTD